MLRAGLAWTLAAACLAHAAAARRPHGTKVAVPAGILRIMDGDTAELRWSPADVETVRVLGIDTPELLPAAARERRDWSRLDARGTEARGFARGAFAVAGRIELLRSGTTDRFRRTLGYFFLDGRNYSVLAIEAAMARETVTKYGDNGLPRQAREVLEAARRSKSGQRRPASSN